MNIEIESDYVDYTNDSLIFNNDMVSHENKDTIIL